MDSNGSRRRRRRRSLPTRNKSDVTVVFGPYPQGGYGDKYGNQSITLTGMVTLTGVVGFNSTVFFIFVIFRLIGIKFVRD